MPDPKKKDADKIKELTKKVEDLTKALAAKKETPPIPPTDPAPDPNIKIAEDTLRDVLKDNFKKEKLESMDLSQLNVAYDLKKNFTPSENLPDPPSGDGDGVGDPKLDAIQKEMATYGLPANLNDQYKVEASK